MTFESFESPEGVLINRPPTMKVAFHHGLLTPPTGAMRRRSEGACALVHGTNGPRA
jgi:hypothetical protein